jgi:hypothetical protein
MEDNIGRGLYGGLTVSMRRLKHCTYWTQMTVFPTVRVFNEVYMKLGTDTGSRLLGVVQLGRAVDYGFALRLQEVLVRERSQGNIPDVLLQLEVIAPNTMS